MHRKLSSLVTIVFTTVLSDLIFELLGSADAVISRVNG